MTDDQPDSGGVPQPRYTRRGSRFGGVPVYAPPSPAGEVAKQLTGAGISIFGLSQAGRLLTSNEPGPWGVPKWLWGLLACVLIAIPTSAYQLRRLAQAVAQLRR